MEQTPLASSLPSACLSSLLRDELITAASSSATTTAAAMDNSFLFDCESLLDKPYDPLAYDPASDPGYFSASSSLSPTSSVDSFCFSPNLQQQNMLDCFFFQTPAVPRLTHKTETPIGSRSSTTTSSSTKRSRSRYPGKKRQTASEREKLRMRDLTKALQHLRTYLPPSVAPAGQTLTKIETLRLTIRYISYLSDQLHLSEDVLEQRSSSFVEQPPTLSQFMGQPVGSYGPQDPDCTSMSTAQLSSLQHSYQVSSGVGFTGEQYWMPQQQLQNAAFSGHC